MEYFWGGNYSNSGKIFILQKQMSCRSLFKKLETLPIPLTSLSIIRKTVKQIHLYTILIEGISITFIDQMQTHLVFKKVHFMLASKFLSVPPCVTILKNDKAKCRAALGKYLNNMLLLLST